MEVIFLMEESILNTIKKMLGLDPTYTVFDTDIIVAINSALMALMQIGIGPKNGFKIKSSDDTWDSIICGSTNLESVKTYVYIKTRLLFDPPSNSSVTEALKATASEIEWRLNVEAENKNV